MMQPQFPYAQQHDSPPPRYHHGPPRQHPALGVMGAGGAPMGPPSHSSPSSFQGSHSRSPGCSGTSHPEAPGGYPLGAPAGMRGVGHPLGPTRGPNMLGPPPFTSHAPGLRPPGWLPPGHGHMGHVHLGHGGPLHQGPTHAHGAHHHHHQHHHHHPMAGLPHATSRTAAPVVAGPPFAGGMAGPHHPMRHQPHSPLLIQPRFSPFAAQGAVRLPLAGAPHVPSPPPGTYGPPPHLLDVPRRLSPGQQLHQFGGPNLHHSLLPTSGVAPPPALLHQQQQQPRWLPGEGHGPHHIQQQVLPGGAHLPGGHHQQHFLQPSMSSGAPRPGSPRLSGDPAQQQQLLYQQQPEGSHHSPDLMVSGGGWQGGLSSPSGGHHHHGHHVHPAHMAARVGAPAPVIPVTVPRGGHIATRPGRRTVVRGPVPYSPYSPLRQRLRALKEANSPQTLASNSGGVAASWPGHSPVGPQQQQDSPVGPTNAAVQQQGLGTEGQVQAGGAWANSTSGALPPAATTAAAAAAAAGAAAGVVGGSMTGLLHLDDDGILNMGLDGGGLGFLDDLGLLMDEPLLSGDASHVDHPTGTLAAAMTPKRASASAMAAPEGPCAQPPVPAAGQGMPQVLQQQPQQQQPQQQGGAGGASSPSSSTTGSSSATAPGYGGVMNALHYEERRQAAGPGDRMGPLGNPYTHPLVPPSDMLQDIPMSPDLDLQGEPFYAALKAWEASDSRDMPAGMVPPNGGRPGGAGPYQQQHNHMQQQQGLQQQYSGPMLQHQHSQQQYPHHQQQQQQHMMGDVQATPTLASTNSSLTAMHSVGQTAFGATYLQQQQQPQQQQVLVGAHGQQMPQASPPNSQGYQCSSGGPSPTLQPHPLAAAAAAAAAAAPGMLQQMGSGYGCGSPMLMSPAGGAQAPLSGAGSLELGGGLQQRYQPLQQQWSQPVVPTTQAAAGGHTAPLMRSTSLPLDASGHFPSGEPRSLLQPQASLPPTQPRGYSHNNQQQQQPQPPRRSHPGLPPSGRTSGAGDAATPPPLPVLPPLVIPGSSPLQRSVSAVPRLQGGGAAADGGDSGGEGVGRNTLVRSSSTNVPPMKEVEVGRVKKRVSHSDATPGRRPGKAMRLSEQDEPGIPVGSTTRASAGSTPTGSALKSWPSGGPVSPCAPPSSATKRAAAERSSADGGSETWTRGRPTFADLVTNGYFPPGDYRFTVGTAQQVEARVKPDGTIRCNGSEYVTISNFALSQTRLRNPSRQACDGWREVRLGGVKLEVWRTAYTSKDPAPEVPASACIELPEDA